MVSIRIPAYAKINLSLEVLNKRSDGYHNIRSVMQSVSLHDSVLVQKTESGIFVDSDACFIPKNEDNLCYKAALLYLKENGIKGGAEIFIEKRIPMAAGLAGGSTDAAATLTALSKLYPASCDLLSLASRIGADVAFCLKGETQLCEGIGDQMTALRFPAKKELFAVVAKNTLGLSTPEIYSEFDKSEKKHPPKLDLASVLKKASAKEVAENLYNAFEEIAVKKRPQIAELKEKMRRFLPLGVLMSGSGPSCFALFDSKEAAEQCEKELQKEKIDAFFCTLL